MSTIYHSAFGGDLVFESNESLEHVSKHSIAQQQKELHEMERNRQKRNSKNYYANRPSESEEKRRKNIINAIKELSADAVEKADSIFTDAPDIGSATIRTLYLGNDVTMTISCGNTNIFKKTIKL